MQFGIWKSKINSLKTSCDYVLMTFRTGFKNHKNGSLFRKNIKSERKTITKKYRRKVIHCDMKSTDPLRTGEEAERCEVRERSIIINSKMCEKRSQHRGPFA